MKIILVDDDPGCIQQLTLVLKDYGIIHSFNDAETAVDAFEHALKTGQRYTFGTIDIGLPSKDGFDLLFEMRQLEDKYFLPDDKKAALCVLTASRDNDTYMASATLGCSGYFVKPVRSRDIHYFLQQLQNK